MLYMHAPRDAASHAPSVPTTLSQSHHSSSPFFITILHHHSRHHSSSPFFVTILHHHSRHHSSSPFFITILYRCSTWADDDAASMMLCVGDGSADARIACATPDGSTASANTTSEQRLSTDVRWLPVAVKEQSGANGVNSVTVELNASAIGNATMMAVRYGWPQKGG
jgi:hypothetical protein